MAKLFSKRRSDGILIEDIEPVTQIMPYVMRGRNESAVYFRKSIDVTQIQNYIRQKRKEGTRITFFNIMVAALLHTIYKRPYLNRFVAGRRLYQHNQIDVNYVVKKSFTDEASESIARVVLNEADNLFTVADCMLEHIRALKAEGETNKKDDKLMSFLAKLPRWTTRSIVALVRWLDFHGFLPADFQEAIPLYSSVFVSHIGSLGAEAPFHHLYEFGTTSIFITIGKTYDKPVKAADGGVEWRKAVDLNFTVDERICDGYYFIKSLRLLEDLLENPETLEVSPQEAAKLQAQEKSKKSVKKALKAARQEAEDQAGNAEQMTRPADSRSEEALAPELTEDLDFKRNLAEMAEFEEDYLQAQLEV